MLITNAGRFSPPIPDNARTQLRGAIEAVPGNLGPFEAATVFALASTELVAEPTDAPAVAFALLLHAVNLLTYVSMGLIGVWAEDVRLGELTRAARLLQGRSSASSLESAPQDQVDAAPAAE